MPIEMNCTGCGKLLRAREDWVGKTIKCPGCGVTAMVMGMGSSVGKRTVTKTTPVNKNADQPRVSIHLETWQVAGIAFVLLLVMTGWVIKSWPLATRDQWLEQETAASDVVLGVVEKAMAAYESELGLYDPSKAAGPKVYADGFLWSLMFFTMPDSIKFNGVSSGGNFSGEFFPATGEIVSSVGVGGTVLPSGIVTNAGPTALKVTGRISNGKVTCEINGKPAELTYRKVEDD